MIVRLIKCLLIYNLLLLITNKNFTSPNHNTRQHRKYSHPCVIMINKRLRIEWAPHSFVRCCCVATAVVREQERMRAPLSETKRERERLFTYPHAGRRSSLVLMPTASFSVRHSHQRLSFLRSILPRVDFANITVNVSFCYYKQIIN